MNKLLCIIFISIGILLAGCMVTRDGPYRSVTRPILFVTTDIGGDPDDQQSMRRLMLYSNEFEIRGLLASASGTPGENKTVSTRPDLILEIIDDFEKVRPSLIKHADGYPEAEALRALVVSGDANRSVGSILPGASTEGSRHLIQVVDEADQKVNVAIWGGARDLAQALCDVRATRSKEELAQFIRKLRVYAIGDQDGYNTVVDGKRVDLSGTGLWIKSNFPDLRYMETNPPKINRYSALFRGMYQNDSKGGTYPVNRLVRAGEETLNNEAWLKKNVLANHGPLGAGYPVVGQNPGSELNTKGVKEGDTPSWFYFLPNGLSDPEFPTWGGWGGRLELDTHNHFMDSQDTHWNEEADEATQRKWTVARWRKAYQNDFAARMDWCVQAFEEANHPPTLGINSDTSLSPLTISAKPGDTISFSATASDPDGDSVSVHWWLYSDVTGVSSEDLTLSGTNSPNLEVEVGSQAAGKQYHLIAEAIDNGVPALTRYRRVILDVD
jgi:hypothetical protein